MEKIKNKIPVVSCGLGDVMLEELKPQAPCNNVLDNEYGMRDILRLFNNGSSYMRTNKYCVSAIEFGGNLYGHLRCHIVVEYYDDVAERRVELYYHGDGMFYAYATMDNGKTFHALFDDHNWRVEEECFLIHDMMDAFRKEFDKWNK